MGVGVRFNEFEIQMSVVSETSRVQVRLEFPVSALLKINAVLVQAQQIVRFTPHLRSALPYIQKVEQTLKQAIDEATVGKK